jgi:hypothetical protein
VTRAMSAVPTRDERFPVCAERVGSYTPKLGLDEGHVGDLGIQLVSGDVERNTIASGGVAAGHNCGEPPQLGDRQADDRLVRRGRRNPVEGSATGLICSSLFERPKHQQHTDPPGDERPTHIIPRSDGLESGSVVPA